MERYKEEWTLKHPAMFPIMLVEKLLDIYTSSKDQIILDPFLGSGTTLIGTQNKGLNGIGLGIKIDIVGVLKKEGSVKLAFIEVKDKPLTLSDLGQLWGYTQLINPIESFLISSSGLGTLEFLFKVLKREDLLIYGQKKEKMMCICKWDIIKKMIDYSSLVPKI